METTTTKGRMTLPVEKGLDQELKLLAEKPFDSLPSLRATAASRR